MGAWHMDMMDRACWPERKSPIGFHLYLSTGAAQGLVRMREGDGEGREREREREGGGNRFQ